MSLLRKAEQDLGNQNHYNPSYKTLVNILTALDEEIKSDLKKKTEAEEALDKTFTELIETKTDELATLHESIEKQEKRKTEAEVELSAASSSYDDTDTQMNHDVEFFDEMKTSCEEKSDEWDERKKMRKDEIDGIKEAIKILTSDEARALFGKAIKPGVDFLQLASKPTSGSQQQAYNVMRVLSAKTKNVEFARLAANIKAATSGRFDDVIAAIDGLITNSKTEEDKDIEDRDECKEEYLTYASEVADLNWKIEKNEAKIAKLDELIESKDAEKAETIKQIQAVAAEVKEMKETRKEENEEFKQGKKDDESAIVLLKSATAALSKFYKDNNIAMGDLQEPALLQEPEFGRSEEDAPAAEFSHKANRKGESKGIVSLLTMITEDLEEEIKNAVKMEEDAVKSFDDRITEADATKTALESKKTNIEGTIAEHEGSKTDEEDDKEDNEDDRTSEEDTMADIKPDCDWIMGPAFSYRAERRAMEVDALKKAKSFLKGAKPSMLRTKTQTLR